MDFEYDPADSEALKSFLSAHAREAEEELMLAILETAIEDFQKYASAKDRKGKLLYQKAEEWILDKDNEWFFSFNNICETLSLGPDQLRRDLLRWRQTKRKAA
ncbi:MAG: hypothetical protein ACM3TN_26240 [Alphaproteobacteria bacterium]